MNNLVKNKNKTHVLFLFGIAFVISLLLLLAPTIVTKIGIPIACIVAIFVIMHSRIYFILFLTLRPSLERSY